MPVPLRARPPRRSHPRCRCGGRARTRRRTRTIRPLISPSMLLYPTVQKNNPSRLPHKFSTPASGSDSPQERNPGHRGQTSLPVAGAKAPKVATHYGAESNDKGRAFLTTGGHARFGMGRRIRGPFPKVRHIVCFTLIRHKARTARRGRENGHLYKGCRQAEGAAVKSRKTQRPCSQTSPAGEARTGSAYASSAETR